MGILTVISDPQAGRGRTSRDVPQRVSGHGCWFPRAIAPTFPAMPTACIQTPQTRISRESERLVVVSPDAENGGEQRRDIPLRDLERMILGEMVSVTMPALAEMLRRRIPVSLVDARGRFLGAFQPAAPDHGAARLAQYQRTLDPAFGLAVAGRIVAAKIYNQRRVVQRMAANRRDQGGTDPVPGGIDTALARMDVMLSRTARCTSLDELRGCEGAASAGYFAAWATFFPPEFPFERRSTRPPLNAVNACLSFAATLLYNECHAFIHAHGLDAALGFLHTTENGRWSLALDLMEPFRPVVAEALSLDLFSHRMLGAKDFEPREGGTYLNHDGRRKLILQYEKRMDRQFMSEHAGHRTTIRQQLEQQAVLLKAELDSPGRFEPFLMN